MLHLNTPTETRRTQGTRSPTPSAKFVKFMSDVAETQRVYPTKFFIQTLSAVTEHDETLRRALLDAAVLALLPVLKNELRHSWAFDDVFLKGHPPTSTPINADIAETLRMIRLHGLASLLADADLKFPYLKLNLRTAFEPLFHGTDNVDILPDMINLH